MPHQEVGRLPTTRDPHSYDDLGGMPRQPLTFIGIHKGTASVVAIDLPEVPTAHRAARIGLMPRQAIFALIIAGIFAAATIPTLFPPGTVRVQQASSSPSFNSTTPHILQLPLQGTVGGHEVSHGTV